LLEQAIARVEQRDQAINSVVAKLYDHARVQIGRTPRRALPGACRSC